MEAMLWSQMGAMLPLVSYPSIPAWLFRNRRESQEKMGKDGWVPKIFFYRPWPVEGKTGKRMIFRGRQCGERPLVRGATRPERERSAGVDGDRLKNTFAAISALSRTRLFGSLWLLVCAAESQSETGRVSTARAQRHLGARYRYQQVSWVVESGCTAGAPRIDCPFGSGEGGM